MEPWDFMTDSDAACCVPRPDWIVPEWLWIELIDGQR